MTDSYEKDPIIRLSLTMGVNDDTIFEDSLNMLHKDKFEHASRAELTLVLGMGIGTVMRLRRRIKELEEQLNDR